MLKNILIGFILVVIWLVASHPLFSPDLFFIHDYVHGARIGEMTRALADGHFPVRWSQNFGYGFGMPLFEFYAPLPYYVGALFYWVTGSLVWSVKFIFGLASLLTALGAYWLGRLLSGRAGGVVTAVAFTLAPYRAVNLFVRGAISEAWGMMAMPFVLLGIILVMRRQKYGWLWLVAGLVTQMLSHNLTTLMFVPMSMIVAGLYWLWIARRQWFKRQQLMTLAKLAGSYMLSACLAAFYVVPAFLEKDLTKINTILGGYFDYHLHFLYIRQLITPYWGYGGSGWGPDDGLSFFLGWGQLLALVIAGGLLVWKLWQTWRQRKLSPTTRRSLGLAGIWGALLAGSLFMTLGRSLVLWDSVALLEFIQFPWRWLSAATMFVALLAGLGVQMISHRFSRTVVAGVLSLVMIVTSWGYFEPVRYLDDASALYYDDPVRIQVGMSSVLQDYVPIQMDESLFINPQPQTQVVVAPISLITSDTTSFEVLVNRTQEKLIKLNLAEQNLAEPTTVEFAVADFPGWQLEIDGQPAEKRTTQQGTIAVVVPATAGDQLVGLYFGSSPIRGVSDIISGVAVLVMGFALLDIPGRYGLKGRSKAVHV